MMKNLKLQFLTLRFEEIKMLEDEYFNEFYTKINDIVDSRFSLKEKMDS
jgi:hypothetical protein